MASWHTAGHTNSVNAQLKRTFCGQRLPAWGVHNQTTVVLLAAAAEDAWARQVWCDEAATRHSTHPTTDPTHGSNASSKRHGNALVTR